MDNLKITYKSISNLTPRPGNPRTHSKKQIRQIARSIERFGFCNSVLIDRAGQIIAGHGRVEAAKLLDLTQVPTICLEDLSEAEIRAYVIADNRIAELAGWDRELLALEIQGLSELDLDFDLTITGFETPEIDILLGELKIQVRDDPSEDLPALEESPVTRPGDLWTIGEHRLFCGDATRAESYERLLAGAQAQMIFTDPPYNVPVEGHVCGLGKVQHQDFAMAVGEMNEAQFTDFLEGIFGHLAHHSAEGAIHYICIYWRHIGEVLAAGGSVYSELKNLCVWAKTNGGMGSLYRSQHELVFVYKAGTAPHINNVELGKHGRYRTNLWSYPGINAFGKDREAALALHPTVKPVALVKDAILDCSHRGGLILDAFAGSGTTLAAAAKAGRRGAGLELDPGYCDVILKRLMIVTQLEPIHENGKTFAKVRSERLDEATPEFEEAAHG